MRLSSGLGKGRKIKTPKGQKTRPTSSMVRQAVFNIIGSIAGKVLLDLYAGSGAVGIEALARGANHVTFIESDINAVRILKENIGNLQFTDRAKTIKGDLPKVLEQFNIDSCQIIFADPPYHKNLCITLLEYLSHKALHPEVMIVLQHDKNDHLISIPAQFSILKTRNYGNTSLSILGFRRKKEKSIDMKYFLC